MLYGFVAMFTALLLISSTFALVYYSDYQQASSQSGSYAGELGTALASYRSLSGDYNSSLRDYDTTLSLLATAVANLNTSTPAYVNASVALAKLWDSYQQLASVSGRRVLDYTVRLLVDFGNGTLRWYNDTSTQPGWNGYVASLVVLKGNVQATWYPQYGEHFVTGIEGVPSTPSTSWFVWKFGGGGWSASQTGADQMEVGNGTTIAWTLCTYDRSYNPTCSP